ncbi:sensor histidine kinase [Hymenobacter properus]|uniref:histidine kinase n=1 Tax=Hymenobacter properus TaxID=2791026 RepID=A0A931BD47_9BACT|nr:PAS domain-containing sensor histidine kinase [Hymenobacter properus]MBF9141624.1 PAS domain S-box protein [Hymenobacter properus]MBR7720433.1 PAS domain S-box protein [Microvirga sp. SRT04]
MPVDLYHNPLTEILFEQAKDFVGLYDVQGRWFTRVNAAGYRLLGYPTAQALYDDPRRTLLGQRMSSEEWAELCDRVLRDGNYTFETELRRLSGQLFWASIELTNLVVENRHYFVIRLTDTDRLHTAERRLAMSVGRFEAVVSHATIGIIMCNADGRIVLANDKAHAVFGYDSPALLSHGIEELVPASVSGYHERLRTSFNARPEVRAMGHNRDLMARRRDGSEFPVEVSLSYFHLDEELFVVAYVVDITFKKDAERELLIQNKHVARLNAELEQKVADRTHALENTLAQLEQRSQELSQALAAEQELGELKSRFVSMASHEFRTPLTGVLTSAALIEKYTTTEQQDKRERHLQRIRTSVKHLTDILEEFLSVGKIEEGRLEAHPAQVALPALLREAQADAEGLRKPGQHVREVFGPLDLLWTDASLLRKVLVNLLSNAFKYSPDQTTVTVRAATAGGWLTLSVQDQGVGIAREDQEHLFERFFRARNAANLPGTGLGLYIIARYMELLGGTVALQSELGHGTTVTITLPYENDTAR